MEVGRKINRGGTVGTMEVGGMVQVEDENEQNLMCMCAEGEEFGERERERGEDGKKRDS